MIGLGLSLFSPGYIPSSLGGGPAPSLPLDDFGGAAAAYSLRKLSSTHSGSAVRVRRTAAPFDEQDIGFTAGGDLDEAAIIAFGGSDVLTVSAWYDQSGNANNATQSTSSAQPQIYNGAAVITDNGKPAVIFDGSDSMPMATIASGSLDSMTVLSVCRLDSTSTTSQFIANGRFSPRIYVPWASGGTFYIGWNSGTNASFGTFDQDQHLWTAYGGTVNSYAYKDGTGGTMTNQTSAHDGTGFVLSGPFGSSNWVGPMQEYIIWNTDQHSNRTGIETNINDYFSIYP